MKKSALIDLVIFSGTLLPKRKLRGRTVPTGPDQRSTSQLQTWEPTMGQDFPKRPRILKLERHLKKHPGDSKAQVKLDHLIGKSQVEAQTETPPEPKPPLKTHPKLEPH